MTGQWIYLKMIKIHFDFSDGTELPFFQAKQALDRGESFGTHCLNFFSTDHKDCAIVCDDGRYMLVSEILENNQGEYTQKQIREAHNLEKMFRAGALRWQPPKDDKPTIKKPT